MSELIYQQHGIASMDTKGDKDVAAGARARGFQRMLRAFVGQLPDMVVPVNGRAEPRVLPPWEHLHFQNASAPFACWFSPFRLI